jgi:NADPH:quinone reductase-like Zn-dependent oxidoreductase
VVGQLQPAPYSCHSPVRAGLEFAGTVLEVLPEAADPGNSGKQQQQTPSFKPGDRVLGVLRFGAFADHVVLPAGYLRPVPEHWSFEQVRHLGLGTTCQGQHTPDPRALCVTPADVLGEDLTATFHCRLPALVCVI